VEVHRCCQVGRSGNCDTENTGDNKAEVPSNVKCDHIIDDSKQVASVL